MTLAPKCNVPHASRFRKPKKAHRKETSSWSRQTHKGYALSYSRKAHIGERCCDTIRHQAARNKQASAVDREYDGSRNHVSPKQGVRKMTQENPSGKQSSVNPGREGVTSIPYLQSRQIVTLLPGFGPLKQLPVVRQNHAVGRPPRATKRLPQWCR